MRFVISTVFSKMQHFSVLTVTGSHVHRKCGNISETVQDRVVVTTDH